MTCRLSFWFEGTRLRDGAFSLAALVLMTALTGCQEETGKGKVPIALDLPVPVASPIAPGVPSVVDLVAQVVVRSPLMAMLVHLNTQLRQRGIDLIVAPVPRKEVVHADEFSSLAPADGMYVANRQRFPKQLLDADIEVIDFVPAYQSARDQHEWFFCDAPDFHPADGGIQVQAREITARMARYEFRQMPGYVPLVSRTRPSEFVVPFDGSGMKKGTRYPATAVDFIGGGHFEGPDGPMPSPLVLMGDSVTVFPDNHADEQNLRAHLTHLCGVKPDHLTSLGGSSQAGRLLARERGDFLADRWVVVFAFAPTRLFGSRSSIGGGKEGWDLVDLPPLKLN